MYYRDISFCDNQKCKRRNDCARALENYEKEEWENAIVSMSEFPGGEDCPYFSHMNPFIQTNEDERNNNIKSINIKKLREKKGSKIISSEEALKDIEPFEWNEEVLTGERKDIIKDFKEE